MKRGDIPSASIKQFFHSHSAKTELLRPAVVFYVGPINRD